MLRRYASTGKERMSVPSTRMAPSATSKKRQIRLMSVVLPAPVWPDQPDHLPGADLQVDVVQHPPPAVVEGDLAQLDGPLDPPRVHRGHGLGDAGGAVEDLEDAVGGGGGPLGGPHQPAHGLQPGVEAPDVGDEGGQHPHGDAVLGHLPDPEAPDDQQPQLGQEGDRRAEEGPQGVDPVLAVTTCSLARPKRSISRRSWVKALTTRMPGMVSASTLTMSAQARLPRSKPWRSRARTRWTSQAMRGKGARVDQGQVRVDGQQDDRGHDDHDQVGGEVQQVHRQEVADAVGVAADPRDQVAGALAAEELQRQHLQVGIGLLAQVRGDALAGGGHDVGARPAEQPGEDRRQAQAAEVEAGAGRSPPVPRWSGGGSGSRRAAAWSGRAGPGSPRSLPSMRPKPSPMSPARGRAKRVRRHRERPGGGRGGSVQKGHPSWSGSMMAPQVGQTVPWTCSSLPASAWARRRMARRPALRELLGGRGAGGGVAPVGQAPVGAEGLQGPGAALLGGAQAGEGLQRPALPPWPFAAVSQQALLGQADQAGDEVQALVEVGLEAGDQGLARGKLGADLRRGCRAAAAAVRTGRGLVGGQTSSIRAIMGGGRRVQPGAVRPMPVGIRGAASRRAIDFPRRLTYHNRLTFFGSRPCHAATRRTASPVHACPPRIAHGTGPRETRPSPCWPRPSRVGGRARA